MSQKELMHLSMMIATDRPRDGLILTLMTNAKDCSKVGRFSLDL